MTAELDAVSTVAPLVVETYSSGSGPSWHPRCSQAAVAGFLFAGIGGRLAMFLLRVTSGSEVIGIESDDGFIIGRFTLATLSFVFFLTLAPMVVVGVLYTVARLWFPPRWRPVVFAIFFGVLGGALIVHRDGIDFVVLSPRILAIALFLAVPVAFGAALEPLHALARRDTHRLPEPVLLALPVVMSLLVIIVGPPGLLAAPIGAALVWFGQGERVAAALAAQPLAWAGRIGMLALASLAAVDLGRDIGALL